MPDGAAVAVAVALKARIHAPRGRCRRRRGRTLVRWMALDFWCDNRYDLIPREFNWT